jgi:hypothetical protein
MPADRVVRRRVLPLRLGRQHLSGPGAVRARGEQGDHDDRKPLEPGLRSELLRWHVHVEGELVEVEALARLRSDLVAIQTFAFRRLQEPQELLRRHLVLIDEERRQVTACRGPLIGDARSSPSGAPIWNVPPGAKHIGLGSRSGRGAYDDEQSGPV